MDVSQWKRDKELSGIVQNKDATDIEERTAIALDFYQVPYCRNIRLFQPTSHI